MDKRSVNEVHRHRVSGFPGSEGVPPSVAGSRSIRKEGGDALPPGDDSQRKETFLTDR